MNKYLILFVMAATFLSAQEVVRPAKPPRQLIYIDANRPHYLPYYSNRNYYYDYQHPNGVVYFFPL